MGAPAILSSSLSPPASVARTREELYIKWKEEGEEERESGREGGRVEGRE